MTTLDELLDKYATEATRIEDHRTSAGYYTHMGLLAKFLLDAKPVIEEAAVKAYVEAQAALTEMAEAKKVETVEQAAERIARERGEKKINAIKDLREVLQERGEDYSLYRAKTLIDAAYDKLGIRFPSY